MEQKQRQRLKWTQKLAIFEECTNRNIKGGVKDIKDVRLWSVQALDFKFESEYNTILRILKDAVKITEYVNSDNYSRKTSWFIRDNLVEKEMYP